MTLRNFENEKTTAQRASIGVMRHALEAAGVIFTESTMELGPGVAFDKRTTSNIRLGRVLSENVLRNARLREAESQRRIGWIFNIADVILAPTTAQPPPRVEDYDRRGGLATDRAMIRACPVTWPWNLLGWPSINIPAGFTSDGLPIGVQLMGPADSEPMLISLAAALEGVNGWMAKQPEPWWDGPALT